MEQHEGRARLGRKRVEAQRTTRLALQAALSACGPIARPAVRSEPEDAQDLVERARAALADAQHALDRAEKMLAAQKRAAVLPAELSRPEQRVLEALAWLEGIGLSPARDVAVACLTGYRVRSAGWVALRRKLRRRGLVDGVAQLVLTPEGRARTAPLEQMDGVDTLLGPLDAVERRILEALLETHPHDLDLDVLARRSGHDTGDDAFEAARGRLRDIGLITSPSPGRMRANDLLRRHAPAGEAPGRALRPRLLRGGLRFSPATERGRTP